MPSVSMSISHKLERAEVIQRLRERLGNLKDTHSTKISDFEETWDGETLTFSFTTFNFKIAGNVVVDTSEVKIVAELPFAAMMFKGAIEKQIRDELQKILA